jgi:H+/Cl- antiporter ClcA
VSGHVGEYLLVMVRLLCWSGNWLEREPHDYISVLVVRSLVACAREDVCRPRVVTGFGAIAFRGLIGFIHNLLFLGQFSFFYDANTYTPPSPWGAFVILVPVIGGLLVTLVVTKFAPEARGHGVPEVMDAVYYAEGRIRPIVAAVKLLASAIAIGSGAAVGREGPIIQIGASLGSTAWERIRAVGIAPSINGHFPRRTKKAG